MHCPAEVGGSRARGLRSGRTSPTGRPSLPALLRATALLASPDEFPKPRESGDLRRSPPPPPISRRSAACVRSPSTKRPPPRTTTWRPGTDRRDPEFKELLSRKARFIIPATIFFVDLLLRAAGARGLVPGADEEEGHRRGELGLPLRALAILHGLGRSPSSTCARPRGWDKTAAALLAKFIKR